MLKYQIEESLFIASSIAESCSMSITKSNVQRLMKDFEVEWWFAPVDSISDIGSAELITNLLILQRQAAFESRVTPSEVINASIDVTDGSLVFTFDTPLKGSTRRTLGRAFYRNNSLYVLWISSLSNIVDGQYGGTLKQIQSSFKLIWLWYDVLNSRVWIVSLEYITVTSLRHGVRQISWSFDTLIAALLSVWWWCSYLSYRLLTIIRRCRL